MPFDKQREEFEARAKRAKAMGSPSASPNAKPRTSSTRERIGRLIDKDTFVEAGLSATSIKPDMRDTPGDGVVSGFAKSAAWSA
jgi:acetyl-CoA carboxylase carboxyltransferase component